MDGLIASILIGIVGILTGCLLVFLLAILVS